MRRLMHYVILAVALLLSACEKSDESKAQDMLDLKMYSEAKTFLEGAVLRNVKNAQLQYLLGVSALALNQDDDAKLPLQRAALLSASKKPLIAKAYSQRVSVLLASGGEVKAKGAADLAADFDPAIRPELGKLFLTHARSALDGKPALALRSFEWAVAFNSTLRPMAGQRIIEYANSRLLNFERVGAPEEDLDNIIRLYSLAVSYDGALSKTAAKSFFDRAVAISDSNEGRAILLYRRAIEFDKDLSATIAANLVGEGSRILTARPFAASDLFESAIRIDPTVAAAASTAALSHFRAALTANDIARGWIIADVARKLPVNKDREIADAALAWVTTAADVPSKAPDILMLAHRVLEYSNKDSKSWAIALFGAMQKTSLSNHFITIQLSTTSVKFDAAQKPGVVEFLLRLGKESLADRTLQLRTASALFDAATALDDGRRSEVTEAVWGELAKRLQNRTQLGASNFREFFAFGVRVGVPGPLKDNVYLLASALDQYLSGKRPQALAQLEQLARVHGATWYGQVASDILAPPPVGERRFDWTPPAGAGLSMGITKIIIGEDGFSLTIRLHAEGHRRWIFYSPNTTAASLGSGACEKPYIVDNNGRRFDSKGNVRGGTQKQNDECNIEIEVAPSNDVEVTVEFPKVSRGATAVKFVIPKDRGNHQSDITWDVIPLKGEPFN